MTSFNILASRSVSCAVDIIQFRIMRRIYQTGINLLGYDLTLQRHYKAPIGMETLSVFEQLHPLDRLVHILTYHAVCYVDGLGVVLLHTLMNRCAGT